MALPSSAVALATKARVPQSIRIFEIPRAHGAMSPATSSRVLAAADEYLHRPLTPRQPACLRESVRAHRSSLGLMPKMPALANNTTSDRADHPGRKYSSPPATPASVRDAAATIGSRLGPRRDELRQCCESNAQNSQNCRHRERVPQARPRTQFPVRCENWLACRSALPAQTPNHDSGRKPRRATPLQLQLPASTP